MLSMLSMLGCGGNIIEAASDELGGSGESGTEVGDVGTDSGSSSGDSTTTDSSTTDSSTTDPSTTDSSTTDPSTTDSTTTDSTTTDSTTTDSSTTDSSTTESTTTDTAMDTVCVDPISFTIQATDFASKAGEWQETMSMLGEGQVMSMPNMPNPNVDSILRYDIDVPCDDTWHIWVRAIDYQQEDSFWVRVDQDPIDWAIFEIDCTMGPNPAAYKWKQLNWRDPNDNGCVYLQDPWTQDWGLGLHELELAYRESYAVSKIWITNTNGNPP